ncbi:potassium-transporting ATPase subunit C [Nocardia inohanensis]|uniref:potassium-transporting ATPase subunit C n=1 Tax=Nocardia inohanensis TaxID=209246 RepID=UPI00083625D2|nr:potassium-transporting ATPase subunit C [Nocardia inohanensis]
MRMSTWIRQHLAALRALLVLTVITGIVYPVAVFAVAQLPGLKDKADGSLIERDGKVVGSSLIGQSFTDAGGKVLVQYFQSRPSAAGSSGYDPTASGASNLGPESMVDSAPDKPALLTTVCARSKAIGELEGVDGSRPFCTPGGVGAVLSVIGPRAADGEVEQPAKVVSVNEFCAVTQRPFLATYLGVRVECAAAGEDYSLGRMVPIRGDAPARPAVPADAVTAGGSGLDPNISPQYADLQIARVAEARKVSPDQIKAVVEAHSYGRDLGFFGEPRVNVVELNLDLDGKYPVRG